MRGDVAAAAATVHTTLKAYMGNGKKRVEAAAVAATAHTTQNAYKMSVREMNPTLTPTAFKNATVAAKAVVLETLIAYTEFSVRKHVFIPLEAKSKLEQLLQRRSSSLPKLLHHHLAMKTI